MSKIKRIIVNIFLFTIAYVIVMFSAPIVLLINFFRKIILNQDPVEYVKIASIGLDQAGGSILYGQENFTVSSFTYFLCAKKHNPYACWFMKFIDFFFGKNHCKNSYYWEVEKDQNDVEWFRGGKRKES